MKNRRIVLGVVLGLLGVPVWLVSIDAVSYQVANRSNGAFVFSGRKREYLLYVPQRTDRTTPTPLVISMHGAGGWPVQQMTLSGWNRLADSLGFIVVYPSAEAGAGPRVWHVVGGEGLVRDVGFIAALIDTLSASWTIDSTRIYANGISNGGGMTFVLSCTLSGRIAAFGMVAAAQTLPWGWCTDRRPAPMIAFHGTADPDIPYNGGTSWVAPDSFPNVLSWTRNWAQRNHCGSNPVQGTVAVDVTSLEYTSCADDATVVLYTIVGGGHTWPGGTPLPQWIVGRTSNGIDATSEMWQFFREHPLLRH